MAYVFQTKAQLYNKVAEEYKDTKGLEQHVVDTNQSIIDLNKKLKESKEELKEKKIAAKDSLENLALECGYKKVGTFYGQEAFSKRNRRNYDIFIFGRDILPLEKRHSNDFNGTVLETNIAHISNIPKKKIKKTAKHQAANMLDQPIKITYGGLAYMAGMTLAGTGAGVYLPLADFGTTSKGIFSAVVFGLGWSIMGLIVSGGSYAIKEISIAAPYRKKKAAKFLKPYKNKGLITHGEEALEKIMS